MSLQMSSVKLVNVCSRSKSTIGWQQAIPTNHQNHRLLKLAFTSGMDARHLPTEINFVMFSD